MTDINFEGFFQVRLATDSDPFADKRGRLGWTYAFGAEPDLDRIVRFNDPVALRSHAPAMGVKVTSVGGSTAHPLVGATVDLDPTTVFEGRNHAIANDGREPLSPMKVSIAKGNFRLVRQSNYVITDSKSRAPYMGQGVIACPDPMVRGTRLASPADGIAFREARKAALQAHLAQAVDANLRTILTNRIQAIEQTGDTDPAVMLLSFAVQYGHLLKDSAIVQDAGNALGANPDVGQPWPISYWLGTFDADTLTAFARGTLSVPMLH